MIKGTDDFMEGDSSLHIPTRAKIDRRRHCVDGYIIVLVCCVILQAHVING